MRRSFPASVGYASTGMCAAAGGCPSYQQRTPPARLNPTRLTRAGGTAKQGGEEGEICIIYALLSV